MKKMGLINEVKMKADGETQRDFLTNLLAKSEANLNTEAASRAI